MRGEVLEKGATENPVESGKPQPWLLIGPLVGVIMENVQKLADSVREGASLDVVCGLGFQLVDRMIKKLKTDLAWTQPQDSCQSLQQLDAGLVRVKMRPSGNDGRAGVIKPLARLYWNPNKNENPPEDRKGNDATEFIGLITTGSFRLTNGSSVGFGAVSLKKLISMIISQRWAEAAHVTPDQAQDDKQAGLAEKQREKKATAACFFHVSYRNKNQFLLEPARIELVL